MKNFFVFLVMLVSFVNLSGIGYSKSTHFNVLGPTVTAIEIGKIYNETIYNEEDATYYSLEVPETSTYKISTTKATTDLAWKLFLGSKLLLKCNHTDNDSDEEDLGDEVCLFKLEKGTRYIIKVEDWVWACDDCWATFDLSVFKAED